MDLWIQFDTEACLRAAVLWQTTAQFPEFNLHTVSLLPDREQVGSRGEDGLKERKKKKKKRACDSTVLLSQWTEKKLTQTETQEDRNAGGKFPLVFE